MMEIMEKNRFTTEFGSLSKKIANNGKLYLIEIFFFFFFKSS